MRVFVNVCGCVVLVVLLCEWPFVHVTVWHGLWLDWLVCWGSVCMIVMGMLNMNVLVCVHCD